MNQARALRMLESVKDLCPYMKRFQNITEEQVKSMAPQCPFMRSTNLIDPKEKSPSPQSIAKKLMDPLTFLDLDKYTKQQPTYHHYFRLALNKLHEEGRYRVFTKIQRQQGQFPNAIEYMTGDQRKITVWCSNDYLGMGQNQYVLKAMTRAIEQFGTGSGGTRNIGGSMQLHVDLEEELADLHDKDAALVCTSGYVANEAALSTLPSVFPKSAIYFTDQENHASMIVGMRNARLPKKDIRIWRHNDIGHLQQLLNESSANPEDADKAKIIVFESVYSMSGTIAPLEQIRMLADNYNAITFIDEVHAVGLYGAKGGGVAQERGIEFDIVSGTLGKAFGVHGGYIAAHKDIIDCIRSYAPGFIFTTSLPPAVIAGAQASVAYLKQSNSERKLLHEHSRYMKKRLIEEDLPLMGSTSHIVPLFIGNPNRCKQVSDLLLSEYGIYVQPINYPTVPRGEELLRLSPGPFHTPELIDEFVAAAKDVWRRLELTTYKDFVKRKANI